MKHIWQHRIVNVICIIIAIVFCSKADELSPNGNAIGTKTIENQKTTQPPKTNEDDSILKELADVLSLRPEIAALKIKDFTDKQKAEFIDKLWKLSIAKDIPDEKCDKAWEILLEKDIVQDSWKQSKPFLVERALKRTPGITMQKWNKNSFIFISKDELGSIFREKKGDKTLIQELKKRFSIEMGHPQKGGKPAKPKIPRAKKCQELLKNVSFQRNFTRNLSEA